jgi:hypothetical protein
MVQLVKVKIGETEFWMEPDKEAVTTIGPKQVGMRDVFVEGISFELFSKPISEICTFFTKTMMRLPDEQRPTKFSTEFGFKTNLEGNIVMVKASGEASLKITAEWDMKK